MLRRLLTTEYSPWQWCLAILAIVFACEFLVMLFLPYIIPSQANSSTIALWDACLLTTMLVPMFWWMIVRPLHRMSRGRGLLLDQILQTQEAERNRIARDLHDEIGQSFTTVLLGLNTFNFQLPLEEQQSRLHELSQTINHSLQEIRRLARGLRPSVLDHLGITQSLKQYLEDFSEKHSLQVTLTLKDFSSEERFSSDLEISLYRIVQESLTNIVRHAVATKASIALSRQARQISLKICDNGRGIEKNDASLRMPNGQGIGLLGMAERVTMLHGTFSVDSHPNRGTCIEITIPAENVDQHVKN